MKKLFLILSAVASLSLSAQVFAHGKDHGKWPCADDVKKLCPDVKKGDFEGAKQCLDEKAKDSSVKLSDKCTAAREKWAAMKKEWEDACGDDVDKFCSAEKEKGDHKALHKCIDSHKSELSDKCKDEMAKMKKMHGGKNKGSSGKSENSEG